MKKSLIVILIAAIYLLESSLYACTAFCTSQDNLVLVGNNEDWKNPFTKIWYEPAQKGKYGRVYFGFDNYHPQGGMNEKGLVFDGFATSPNKIKKSLNKPTYGGNLIDKFMSECATVKEALRIFDKYNLQFMERAMFFIADEQGDSAIIEGDEIVHKNGKYQIITNFYQSQVKDGNIPCRRYQIAEAMLKNADGICVDLCKRILAGTHQEGQYPTVYSNVYDLKKRVVYLYHFHNFQNEVRIDLIKELQKGKHTIDLPDLFPKTYVAESFKNTKARELEARKAKFVHKVKPEILESYVGQYRIAPDEGEEKLIKIKRVGDKLFGYAEEQEIKELYPVSDTQFEHISTDLTVKLTFVKGKNGKVSKLIVDVEGQSYTATRIK
jgi:hypothetical protein